MSERTKVIRLSDEMFASVKALAERDGVGVYDAAESLLRTAINRRAAVTRYAKAHPKRAAKPATPEVTS